MYIYIYIYIFIYIYIYTTIHTYMYIHTQYTYIHIYIHTYIYTYQHTYIHIHTYTHFHRLVACIRRKKNALHNFAALEHIPLYAHTHTHTHTHISAEWSHALSANKLRYTTLLRLARDEQRWFRAIKTAGLGENEDAVQRLRLAMLILGAESRFVSVQDFAG